MTYRLPLLAVVLAVLAGCTAGATDETSTTLVETTTTTTTQATTTTTQATTTTTATTLPRVTLAEPTESERNSWAIVSLMVLQHTPYSAAELGPEEIADVLVEGALRICALLFVGMTPAEALEGALLESPAAEVPIDEWQRGGEASLALAFANGSRLWCPVETFMQGTSDEMAHTFVDVWHEVIGVTLDE